MNSEDPSNQKELLKKLVSLSVDDYLNHLSWEDIESNRSIVAEFISHLHFATGSGINVIYSVTLQPYFVELLKAHFEILKAEDKDLSEEEWDKVDSGLGIDRGDASYDVQGLGHQTNPENFKLDVEEAEAVLHDVKRVGLSLNGGKFPGTKASEAHRLMVEVSDRLRELRALLQTKI